MRATNAVSDSTEAIQRGGCQPVIVTVGGGGFSSEALALVAALGPHYQYVYVLGDLREQGVARRLPFPGRVVRLTVPALMGYSFIRRAFRFLACTGQSFSLVRRERPLAVIALGGSHCVPLLLAARCYGVRTVFVESLARTRGLSFTGRVIRLLRLSHRFYVQWPSLQRGCPGTVYRGRTL